jgi:hypothetical protein
VTAALKCDGCGTIETEPARAERWLRLDRYGPGSIAEPHIPGEFPEMRMMMGGIHIEVQDDVLFDDGPVGCAPELSEEDALPVTNHFCRMACLAEFSQTLAMLEGPSDGCP